MNTHFHRFKRALAAALVTLRSWQRSPPARSRRAAHRTSRRFVKSNLVQVDVYDRADGLALPVYQKDGRNYIVGVPGHEYAVRIRNTTGGRVLAVTSVDGVNVISGDTAAPSQSGYVLDPWGSVEIAGWRKSMSRTAAFYFTDLGDSYAARTGRPQNVGVIGVAVFQERPKRIAYHATTTIAVVWRSGIAAAAVRERARSEAQRADAQSPPPAQRRAGRAARRNRRGRATSDRSRWRSSAPATAATRIRASR